MWQHNLYLSFKSRAGFELFGGANNLLNAQPDFAMTNYPTSPLGRYLYAGVRVSVASR
jgi:outer membrane receptor protein involved in Fe transport